MERVRGGGAAREAGRSGEQPRARPRQRPAPAVRPAKASRGRAVAIVFFFVFILPYSLIELAHGIALYQGSKSYFPDFTLWSRSETAPPAYQSASAPPLVEEKPSLLQGTLPLSASQVRYCLAQEIRMQGAAKAVNTASAPEAGRFLALAEDYNPRCGNYHYAPGVFDSIKEEVEARRAALELQGAVLVRPPDVEEKPPVAPGALLPESQVRYCLAQGIRIQGAARAVNTAVAAEASRFIALEDDYEPRCGNFRPAAGVTNAVKEQVEARRAALEREGVVLVRPAARF